MMSVLGGWSPRLIVLHAAIAVLSVGAMWSIFTFGLRVMLPEGELIGRIF
jgi:cytochrome c biogenesis protein ResB